MVSSEAASHDERRRRVMLQCKRLKVYRQTFAADDDCCAPLSSPTSDSTASRSSAGGGGGPRGILRVNSTPASLSELGRHVSFSSCRDDICVLESSWVSSIGFA